VQQLVRFSDEYIIKYVRRKGIYLSNIKMEVDEDHRGDISMTYTYERNGCFRSYSVEMSSREHLIYGVYRLESTSTVSSRNMDFDERIIDCDEAAYSVIKSLRNEGYELNVSKIHIDARMPADYYRRWYIYLSNIDLEMLGYVVDDEEKVNIVKTIFPRALDK